MKRLDSIIYSLFSLTVFQNVYVLEGCKSCKYKLELFPLFNGSSAKSDDFEKHSNSMTTMKSISRSIDLGIPEKIEPTSNVRSVDDLMILLGNQTWLSGLSVEEKKSVVTLLTSSSYNRFVTSPLPRAVLVNLIDVFASTSELFSGIGGRALYSVLAAVSYDGCVLHDRDSVPTKVLVQFLNGLLSLSPGTLNGIPKSVLVPVLGSVRSSDVLNALPHSAALNLVTALSLSVPLFNCLPAPTLTAVLEFVAGKPSREIVGKLPPSTVFGFTEGLLATVKDSPAYTAQDDAMIPHTALAAVLGNVMTSRMLSVMAPRHFDLMLSALGSSPALSKALPASNFVSVFSVLTSSPKLLSSLDPVSLGATLETIAACPSILNSIPSVMWTNVINSVAEYLPSCFNCIATNAIETLIYHANY